MIHIGKYYAKDDTTLFVISSYKANPEEIKRYGTKRIYIVHFGNDTAGYYFRGRFFSLKEARKAMMRELTQ